jgi:hypothetical protein
MAGLLTINSKRTKVPTEAGTFACHSNVVRRLGRATLTVAILVVFLVTELTTLLVRLLSRLPLSGIILLRLPRLPGTAALLSTWLIFIHIVCHEKSSMQSSD